MTIAQMKERKQELGFTNEMLAERSGVPLGTVQKVFAGATKAPRLKTIRALEKALSEGRGDSSGEVYIHPAGKPSGISYDGAAHLREPQMVRESFSAYAPDPKQGHYTIEDYYALPEERRAELIDGWIYDMPVPGHVHQLILGELYLQLAPCVAGHPDCEIYFAPLDVRLDKDEWTMVQPDLLIVCGKRDHTDGRINGAPDFVVEILSPSSRYHDMFRKLNKYKTAGVREYWIVDPERLQAAVYHLEADRLPETYGFSDKVDIRISAGECSVDFSKVYARIKKYYRDEG